VEADKYQYDCLRTAGTARTDAQVYAAFGLSGESGELSELVRDLTIKTGKISDLTKKLFFHGHPYSPEKFLDELGDVAWYLAVLAHSHGYKLSEVFQFNLDKLAKRYPDGFSSERSINRDS
jgi:NTP pyrophosphatase (non-canonical NTP hydrolase)